MWRLRSPYRLNSGIVGGVYAVVLVAAVALAADGIVAIAAVGVFDAVVIGLSPVLSALVAVAGTLLAADIRADRDCARVCQGHYHPVAWTIDQSVDENTTHAWDIAYVARPQDERLQAILRAHRHATPTTTPHDSGVITEAFAENKTKEERESASIDTVISIGARNLDSETIVTAVRQSGLTLVANTATVKERDTLATRGTRPPLVRPMRNTPKVRRVANAERWWSAHDFSAESLPWSVAFRRAADVIVLADRGGRTNPPSLPDHPIDATAPAQPACRGPPYHADAGRSPPPQTAFGGRHRSKVDAATAPDAIVVVDNLGDGVAVRAAELDVVETHLSDVLSALFTAAGVDRNGQVS